MIISEKQIIKLIECAIKYLDIVLIMNNDEHIEYSEKVDILLYIIENQQSEELTVIE